MFVNMYSVSPSLKLELFSRETERETSRITEWPANTQALPITFRLCLNIPLQMFCPHLVFTVVLFRLNGSPLQKVYPHWSDHKLECDLL